MTQMRVLVVDNYDSFVYNLVQAVGEVITSGDWMGLPTDGEVIVRRNDSVTLDDIDALAPNAVVVSPGPGTPSDAGISTSVFGERSYPTLGVCLGHQALCAANGAEVGYAPSVVHGKDSPVCHDGRGIFRGLPDRFDVGRYHSLAIERTALPAELEPTATTEDESRIVMGVRHVSRPHVGVQFHPESILTDRGNRLIANFLSTYTSP